MGGAVICYPAGAIMPAREKLWYVESMVGKGKDPGGQGGRGGWSRRGGLPGTSFLWPPPVEPGEVVAVAAPASAVTRAAGEAGVRILKDWGFKVRWGPEVFQARPWDRAADEAAARRFLELWQDPEVKAVLGVRGGYGSLKVLPYLDVDALTPKRLVGYSDLTNLLWHLHRHLGLVTFHGPTVAHLPELTPGARENFYRWLTAPEPLALTYRDLTELHPGTAEGPLAGGNLTTLCHLVGTPFAPQMQGYLLFLEDRNEALYRVDRMLHHLRLSGMLSGVKGVVLGAFTHCGSQEGLLEVAAAALAPLQVPVLAGLPVGHQPENHTLPLGVRARLDAGARTLNLLP
jgi:muramoyltetrapeptide carboxypeptidase